MGDDAFDDRHDGGQQPKPDNGSQQPGTPDPRPPGPGRGDDAADGRH